MSVVPLKTNFLSRVTEVNVYSKSLSNVPQLVLEHLPRILLLDLTQVPMISGSLEPAFLAALQTAQQQPPSIILRGLPRLKTSEGEIEFNLEQKV